MAFEDPTNLASDTAMDESRDESVSGMQEVAAYPVDTDLSPAAEPTSLQGGATTVPPLPTPIPTPVLLRTFSGSYRSPNTPGFQLELRVDVDGAHPLRKLSADFFSLSGATLSYFGSFVVDSPVITTTSSAIVIRGPGRFTWSAGASVVQVTIPKRTIFQPAAAATVSFFSTGGAPGASYVCPFGSRYLRTVQIETDRVSDVTTPVFTSYNTGTLPSGGAARTLSVVAAYAEASIQMLVTSGSDVINISEAGSNAKWSDAELHASMVHHFSVWHEAPQWAVWQVVCQHHELGDGLLGIMFDQQGLQRQGCAVFHAGMGGTGPTQLREQLYCYVHELGHCFNLLHSWQKSLGNPPGVDRPSARSYMNYPWRYPGGEAAFWAAFGFVFDDPELIHLRHAFRNNIIMGGSPFATGSSMSNPEIMADPVSDRSGLQFRIAGAHDNFALGEPVSIHLSLSPSDLRGKTVYPHVHPSQAMVSVVIAKPNGQVVVYEPYIDHLMSGKTEFLAAGQSIEDVAYIGFGKGGLYFEQPGSYTLRAVYHALDGSRVLSNVLKLRVRNPATAENDELAHLLLGEEQGALFYLQGSDSEALRAGNDAFDTLLEKHGSHRLADYVRFAKGVNAARSFKTIHKEQPGGMWVRAANLSEAHSLMMAAATGKGTIDDLTRMRGLNKLAALHHEKGDEKSAKSSLKLAQDIAALRAAK